MKKYFQKLKEGIILGIGILVTLIIGGVIYATISFEDLPEVEPGNALTAQKWNILVNAVNSIKGETNSILSNLNTLSGTLSNTNVSLSSLNSKINTLSGTVDSIKLTIPNAPTLPGQVVYKGKYWYNYSGNSTTSWTSAFDGCSNLGYGWRLPSMSELRYLYTNKNVSPLNTLNLISGWYWSEIYFLDANYGRIAMLVKMSDGTRAGNYGSNSNYSVCIYD